MVFVFCLGFGLNFFLHGLTKLMGDQEAFKSFIVEKFSSTIIPTVLLEPYAASIAYIELILGITLILGVFYYWSVIFSMLTMISLMVGMILVKDWSTVGIQLAYLIYLFLLGVNINSDKYCIDSLFSKEA